MGNRQLARILCVSNATPASRSDAVATLRLGMNRYWLDANDFVRHYVVARHKYSRNHVSGHVQRRREDIRNCIDRDQQSDALHRNTHAHD